MDKPNTDSTELEKLLDNAYQLGKTDVTLSANDYPVIMPKIKQQALAYTANKQRQLLEWVEQELPLKMSLTSPTTNNWGAGFNEALNQTHQIVKNKKESL